MVLNTVNRNIEPKGCFVKTGEAARLLGLSRAAVRAAVRRGELSGIRLGSRFLVSRKALEHLLTVGGAMAPNRGERSAN